MKKINISGNKYELISVNGGGGYFSCTEQKIKIGNKGTDQYRRRALLHEICEAIFAERDMRLSNEKSVPENGDYMFVFNHAQFENFIKDLATALEDIGWVKINKSTRCNSYKERING